MRVPDRTPAPSTPHLGYIQGLRAVAVLLVVAFHAGLPVSGGYIGVDVFFVISGFVITAMLLRELSTNGRIRFLNFYRRRVRRLLPALATMLVTVLVAAMVLQSPFGTQQSTARIGGYASVFLANLALYRTSFGYFDPQADTYPLLHTWSLGVEEQFYLGLPLLLAISYLLFRRTRRPLLGVSTVVLAVSAVSLALYVFMSRGHTVFPSIDKAADAAFYLPITRLWEFGAGALLAVWLLTRPALRRAPALVLGLLGAALLAYGAVEFTGSGTSVGARLTIPIVGVVLLVAAGRTEGTVVNRLLALPPMQWLGDTSYGWYLWHFPLIVFTTALWSDTVWARTLAAIVALGVARVSYRTVEQRFRYPSAAASPRVDARRTVALALVCVGVPVLCAAGLQFGAQHSWGSAAVRSTNAQIEQLHFGATLCSSPDPVAHIDACTIGADRPGRPIVLLGDSTAGQYTEALLGASRQLDRPLVLAMQNGCPYADVRLIVPGFDGEGCRRGVYQLTRYLHDRPPATVVVASVNIHIDATGVALGDPRTGRVARTSDEKRTVWRQGMVRTIDRLESDGDQVVMMRVNPQLGGVFDDGLPRWHPGDCTMLTVLDDIRGCALSGTLSSQDRQQSDALAAERYTLARTGAAQLDLRGVLCPQGECHTISGTRWLYRDGTHISVSESRALAPYFERGLRAASNLPN